MCILIHVHQGIGAPLAGRISIQGEVTAAIKGRGAWVPCRRRTPMVLILGRLGQVLHLGDVIRLMQDVMSGHLICLGLHRVCR
jgi:hypothetical protein